MTLTNAQISDVTRGFHAAAATEPFDEFESADWQYGYRLWHTRETCKRDAERHPMRSVRTH